MLDILSNEQRAVYLNKKNLRMVLTDFPALYQKYITEKEPEADATIVEYVRLLNIEAGEIGKAK